jgi:hypothetical protein
LLTKGLENEKTKFSEYKMHDTDMLKNIREAAIKAEAHGFMATALALEALFAQLEDSLRPLAEADDTSQSPG